MIKYILAALAVMVSFNAHAKPVLPTDVQKDYAGKCAGTVYHAAGQKRFLDNSFRTHSVTIDNIDSLGADITAHISFTRKEKSGGNNGWGKEVTTVKRSHYECKFDDQAKGKTEYPDYFISYWSKSTTPVVWAKITNCPTSSNIFADTCNSEDEWGRVDYNYDNAYWTYYHTGPYTKPTSNPKAKHWSYR